VEGKYIADAIQANLEYFAWCTIWEHAFDASGVTIESLLTWCTDTDFAVFVFSEDDIVKMRSSQHAVPRDNVVFESGMFMGELGRDRVFIVVPRDVRDFHMPTDLSGFTSVNYESARAKRKGETDAALTTAANKIEMAIQKSSWSTLKLSIATKVLPPLKDGLTFPLKLEFIISNPHAHPVTIQSVKFALDPGLRFAPNSNPGQHKPRFLRIKHQGLDDYFDQITIESRQKVLSCWIPIHPEDEKMLQELVGKKQTGTWTYRCIWLKEHVVVCKYEQEF